LQSDLTIFAGMNEGVWPSKRSEDPWLNLAMRKQIGLPPLEQRLGFAAHDLISILTHKEVILTRSVRQEGKVMRPSVFWRLVHLAAHKNGVCIKELTHLTEWVRQRRVNDRPREFSVAPQGLSQLEHLPKKISISNATLLFKNPYVFYAKCVLALKPLRSIGPPREEIQFGLMIHWILKHLVDQKNLGRLSTRTIQFFIKKGLQRYMDQVIARPFWQRRTENIVQWCLQKLSQDSSIEKILTEVSGTLEHDFSFGTLVLKGIADRIDLRKDGLVIIDYKTGQLPTQKAVLTHQAPQLSLEAALYYFGSLQSIKPKEEVLQVSYWKLSGKERAGQVITIKETPRALAQNAFEAFKKYIDFYYSKAQPFKATPTSVDPYYDHLIRLKQWTGEMK
jgi:ATP-dependent helicase/nuclease subunit B